MPGAEGLLGGQAVRVLELPIIMQSCEPHRCSSLLPTWLGLQSIYQVLDIGALVSSVFHEDRLWFNKSSKSPPFRNILQLEARPKHVRAMEENVL